MAASGCVPRGALCQSTIERTPLQQRREVPAEHLHEVLTVVQANDRITEPHQLGSHVVRDQQPGKRPWIECLAPERCQHGRVEAPAASIIASRCSDLAPGLDVLGFPLRRGRAGSDTSPIGATEYGTT